MITSASVSGGTATVSGTLNSTPGKTFRLEFFSNTACDSSGYGEGQTFIGSKSVTTDATTGDAPPFTFTSSLPVPAGQSVITSTATDPDNNTSEFSKCLSATTTNPPPPPGDTPPPGGTPPPDGTPPPTTAPHHKHRHHGHHHKGNHHKGGGGGTSQTSSQ